MWCRAEGVRRARPTVFFLVCKLTKRGVLVRVTTVFRRLLNVASMFVMGVSFVPDGLLINVRPSWKNPQCGICGIVGPGYDTLPVRRWRSLGIGAWKIWLAYALRRVACPACGIRAEKVPWAAHASRFTSDFAETVAYLAQTMDQTAVTKLMGITWRAVENIVAQVVFERLDANRFDGVRRIGIDEFSYRKRHHYLTVIVNHDTRRVIWACEGRSAVALSAFFERLGPQRCALIETVTIDMSHAYKKAVTDNLPNAEIVYDRFHVQRIASIAVDKVRRELWRELKGTEEGKAIKGSRFALLKNPWNLTQTQKQRLAEVQLNNARLYRAYLLKETLAKALDYLQPWRAERALKDWLAWASRSKLKPFVEAARTVRRHFDGILAYIKDRLTNGLVEGINNRLRVIARRAYGYHSPDSLTAILYLCCGGIELDPPLPQPT